ncbi:hypothetical protein DRN97_04410 [Methanosarcinales archaeon]|nr:MAG: hypothetical protein DRN97_04410 [Methanosarcinales archaeon]
MGEILVPGQRTQISSRLFNFLTVANQSSFQLNIEASHDNLANPVIAITGIEIGNRLPGQSIQIASHLFNFLTITNQSPYQLNFNALHDNLANPIIVITDVKSEIKTEEIENRLRSLKGFKVD